jgi:hypothetical protein
MNIVEIVEEWLIQNNKKGLACHGMECECKLTDPDFMDCYYIDSDKMCSATDKE